MADTTSRLGLPLIAAAQAQKHVTHNEALQILDGATQLCLHGIGTETPPLTPASGETHMLGPSPSGAWFSHGGDLAHWQGTMWAFVAPKAGWRAWDVTNAQPLIFDGSDWIEELQNLSMVGVGTMADVTNPLSIAGAASLFTHVGAGHQVKVNKASDADTSSLLFQSNWTGHAEMGLAGDTDFHLKVSADGSTWTEALTIKGATGTISGSAVQSDAFDSTIGKLMAVGAFGLGAQDDPAGAQSNGEAALGNGFYFGAGAGANTATFPTAGSASEPFLSLCGPNDAASVSVKRLFFDGNVLIIAASDDNGQNWDAANTVFGTTNAVGTVSEAGGTPTGALIESGQNANGEYVRWADGTQICTNSDAPITTDPASFVGTVTSIDGGKLKVGRWF